MKSVSLAAIATLVLSCFTLTKTATASSSVDFSNNGGTLSGSNAGLSLSGSTLVVVNGLNGGGIITGNDLGTVTFTTGALTSGTLSGGGTFASWGTFTIGPNGFTGSTMIGSGNTNVTPTGVPEPSSLVLLLTGSLSMLGAMRGKLLVR